MPEVSWDWSIAVPLSQEWHVGDHLYVGGQISSNETGPAVHVGDLSAQARAMHQFLENVSKGGNASFDDIAHVKTCVKHESRGFQSYATSTIISLR